MDYNRKEYIETIWKLYITNKADPEQVNELFAYLINPSNDAAIDELFKLMINESELPGSLVPNPEGKVFSFESLLAARSSLLEAWTKKDKSN